MKIKFWGVRGSIPVPGPGTVKYGGNTSCLELVHQPDQCIILEGGSGLRVLGMDLLKRGKTLPEILLFISHTHWDHIQGFPFFVPNYIKGTRIKVQGPVHFAEKQTLQSVFDMQMRYEVFPISNAQLSASISYEALGETKFQVGDIQVRTQFANHPILSLSYRFTQQGRTVVYTGDHEPYHNLFKDPKATGESKEDDLLFGDVDSVVTDANRRFVDFVRDADVVVDCQYTPDEYRTTRKNWGHSSWDYCLQWMKEGNVKRMVLTHHDPLRTDADLDANLAKVRDSAKEMGLDADAISMALEGMEVEI
jgi:phosphoribosyl 1,2-cyclic phosphodiesterase